MDIFNIVQKKKVYKLTSEHFLSLSQVLLLLLLLGFSFEVIQQPNTVAYILSFLLFITPYLIGLYGSYEYEAIDFEKISYLKLDHQQIIVDDHEIPFQDIKKIELNINDWKGRKIDTGYSYGRGPNLSQGVDNYITFTLKNEESKKLNIQLESKSHFLLLGRWIESMYKSKIIISEQFNSLRSYGLKHLNYEEIQKFKEEVNKSIPH